MYYLTVEENSSEIVRRKPFGDYCEAIGFLSQYLRPRSRRSVLEFTTEVINGAFARSYVTVSKPETIDRNSEFFEIRYSLAAKQSNAFEYGNSYFFLIESDVGVHDADMDDNDE